MTEMFDIELSEEMKEIGMNLAACARPRQLEVAREIAVSIARKHGTVNMDDVNKVLNKNYPGVRLGNAAGSVFKTDYFEFTGYRIKSSFVPNHARELKVWRLK